MTLKQQALNVIERLPNEKIYQVIQFAEFLSLNSNSSVPEEPKNENKNKHTRKPGILKQKIIMSDDFDETPECFKEYL